MALHNAVVVKLVHGPWLHPPPIYYTLYELVNVDNCEWPLTRHVLVVIAEFGDYSEEQCDGHAYLSDVRLLPGQIDELEIKIMEHHIEHRRAQTNSNITSQFPVLHGRKINP